MKRLARAVSAAVLAATAAIIANGASAAEWFPYDAVRTDPPFAADGKSTGVSYTPLARASRPWKLCVSFPHMKDAYWLGVDYGVAEEARRIGVGMNLVEAGGYAELSKQISQIENCVANGANAVIIGSISFDGLNNLVAELARKNVPVIDVVNGISSPEVTAKSLVSFRVMGAETGAYLARLHPAGSEEAVVAWFPGPAGAGWVQAAHEGFMSAVKGSAIRVLQPKFGDTGKEVQLKLVEDELQGNPQIRYVAGTAVTAEVAQSLVRERGLQGKVDVLAFYMTPGVYEGIRRGSILAAPADSMVIQGRIAVDQAVRILEGKDYVKHVGPRIFMIDKANVAAVPRTNILPPNGFRPVFAVE